MAYYEVTYHIRKRCLSSISKIPVVDCVCSNDKTQKLKNICH